MSDVQDTQFHQIIQRLGGKVDEATVCEAVQGRALDLRRVVLKCNNPRRTDLKELQFGCWLVQKTVNVFL